MSSKPFGELEIQVGRDTASVGVPGERQRTVEATRAALAAFVRTADDGRYRPLSGARTLPRGWSVQLGSQLPLEAALEAVYPLAIVHREQWAAGTLDIVPLNAVLERQSGRYEATASLSERGRELAVEILCGGCVRRPVWHGTECWPDEIPCPEACSVMVALCREAALWEANRPDPAPSDASVAFAAFDVPGNELRERYLSAMIDAHD